MLKKVALRIREMDGQMEAGTVLVERVQLEQR